MYTYIEPEVAGGLGNDTDIDNSVHPPKINKLHYEFADWLGDDIVETFPCYIVTKNLMLAIIKEGLTGVSFDILKITKSPEFINGFVDLELADFHWMKINGVFGIDDFVIAVDYRLLISDKAKKLLNFFNINYAILEDFVL